MSKASKIILEKLLDRLYASLVQGPCLNCRPHSSRQRVDLTTLESLRDVPPNDIIPQLLNSGRQSEITARVPPFRSKSDEENLSGEELGHKRAAEGQERLLSRLRDLASDAFDYEQETGESALYIGYPLLSVTPGTEILGDSSGRILAPIALVAIDLVVKRGAAQSVILTTKGAGVDLVVANFPLLAWLEQQTGENTEDLFTDEEGTEPYKEINEIVRLIGKALKLQVPEFKPELPLSAVPRLENLTPGVSFLNSAVIGLFPVSNQGLLRDMKNLIAEPECSGPAEQFLSVKAMQHDPALVDKYERPTKQRRIVEDERLICPADPCQSRATRLAKTAPAMVIHGPPGTGKSQTITNIIGDHLARGERVLMVCDKRTAIDVVRNRLDHLGLGHLCAVVHDAQRDQRGLYMSIREYLENLVERRSNAAVDVQLKFVDDELQKLHLELSGYSNGLAEPPVAGELDFHRLVGEWLSTPAIDGFTVEEGYIASAKPSDLEKHAAVIRETLERTFEVNYPRNPWSDAAGLELGEFLSRPSAAFRERLEKLKEPESELKGCPGENLPPLDGGDLMTQASERDQLATRVKGLGSLTLGEALKAWLERPTEVVARFLEKLKPLEDSAKAFSVAPLDHELLQVTKTKPPDMMQLNSRLSVLSDYSGVAKSWHGFLHVKKKVAAEQVASGFGLHIDPAVGERLGRFVQGLKERLLCQGILLEMMSSKPSEWLLPDMDLVTKVQGYRQFLGTVQEFQRSSESLRHWLLAQIDQTMADLGEKLKRSADRARAVARFTKALEESGFFSSSWLAEKCADWRAGKPADALDGLLAHFDTMEAVLRARLAYVQIPSNLCDAVASLIYQSAEADTGYTVLKRAILGKEISARIRNNPFLQQVEQKKLERCFARYRELESNKYGLVRDLILHRWLSLQKSRLLASTGTQLNSLGAAIKRRLVTRGERALKLRQVIHMGAGGAEADPLFDICPVWMASPATVAQIFPRHAIFDVVIFDEASQCRLEEAIPVLLRGKRVVVAGDPKQLPPTRFFETAIVASGASDSESEEDLFEQQLGETEDLLGAALNTAVQQAYLDVHYRSRDEALIGFSNKNFYNDRLQPIPCHPGKRRKAASIQLIRGDGVYEDRGNKREASIVADLVEKLLSEGHPPSIGIACFNLTQRDAILDELETRCESDPAFSERFALARKRRGAASFEGLFVKNLENVQGDERDHIIISTTFGPDPSGKFRRNFGPLSQAGGGRRLNVLVTRAREMIHLVTSIPPSEYRMLAELEPGQLPNGRWLLYAYLSYAEFLERKMAEEQARVAGQKSTLKPQVQVQNSDQATRTPVELARRLAANHGLSSIVPWGTPGFCMDLVLQHPDKPEEVTIGVLCDMTRFEHVADAVEWEIFRTAALEQQGWRLHRVWSTSIYADPAKQIAAIAHAASCKNGVLAKI